jgi:hypothetical protein
MRIAEIFHDRPGFRLRELGVVLDYHSFHYVLPAFGCGTRPGNALHVSMFVAAVASPAFCDHKRIGDRDARLGIRFGLAEDRTGEKRRCDQGTGWRSKAYANQVLLLRKSGN